MGQRECILPLTKLITVASGASVDVDITDSQGNIIDITYCTLLDLSSAGTADTDGWMRIAPGPPSAVAYYSNEVVGTAHTAGALGVEASAINSASAVPGVIGPGGTALILSTQESFNKVVIENALYSTLNAVPTSMQTLFALTYGHITTANTTKDQQRQEISPVK